MSKQPQFAWFPETPAGTVLMHLESKTEEEAWKKLLKDASHMPYKTKENFIKRGYKVLRWEAAK